MASSSSSTKLVTLCNPQNGGALFILPRELRDKIYRLLIKDKYYVPTPHCCRSGPRDGSDLTIFRVSKAINYEATETWLSESLFLFVMPLRAEVPMIPLAVFCPAKTMSRMKTIKFDLLETNELLYCGGFAPMDSIDTHVAPFTEAHIERKCVTVQLQCAVSDSTIVNTTLSLIWDVLKAMTGFETLVVKIRNVGPFISAEHLIIEHLHQIGQSAKEILEPALGPATKDHGFLTVDLTFHPSKYLVGRSG